MRGAALPPSDFCLIRHGETTANAQSIIAGVTDVALTARGRDQARALARRRWPQPVTLFASPAARARETCKLAFAQIDQGPYERQAEVILALFSRDSRRRPDDDGGAVDSLVEHELHWILLYAGDLDDGDRLR